MTYHIFFSGFKKFNLCWGLTWLSSLNCSGSVLYPLRQGTHTSGAMKTKLIEWITKCSVKVTDSFKKAELLQLVVEVIIKFFADVEPNLLRCMYVWMICHCMKCSCSTLVCAKYIMNTIILP